jgi:hypothetical protein
MNRCKVCDALADAAHDRARYGRCQQETQRLEALNIARRERRAGSRLELPPGLAQARIREFVGGTFDVAREAFGVELDVEAIHTSILPRL